MDLDLVELTPGLRAQLEAESQSLEPTELREELPTCPPNRWYQSGFLIPSKTNLGEHADDAEEDEFAGFSGLNVSSKGKSNANGDDTGASEGGQAQRVFFPCSIELRLLLLPPPTPPGHQECGSRREAQKSRARPQAHGEPGNAGLHR